MCGFVGVISSGFISDRSWLFVGLDKLGHRGPDDSAVWWSECGRVGLGHSRLSIVDLSSSARQPMLDDSNGNAIVFNGEIYNYKEIRQNLIRKGYLFKTDSDTEVILNAYQEWGCSCISKLDGMFSFGIYDRARQSFFVARDRVGEKPLFYLLAGDRLIFGSELKAILADRAVDRKINTAALDCYFAMGFVPKDMCIIDQVRKLPAAHAFEFKIQENKFNLWRYWDLPEYKNEPSDSTELILELTRLIDESVARQLDVEVPFGVLLSGGMDSSLVSAFAAKRSRQKLKTFTVTFPNNNDIDESKHAKLVSEYLDTDHTEIQCDHVSVDVLLSLARQYDEPLADSSVIPTYLICKHVSDFCKVVLGGDGGDELFGGYRRYSKFFNIHRYSKRVPVSLKDLYSKSVDRLLPAGLRGKNALLRLGFDLSTSIPYAAPLFSVAERVALFEADIRDGAECLFLQYSHFQKDVVSSLTRTDFETYLPDNILVKTDRASMLNSLEMRSPLLDRSIVEFAFSKVPHQLKATSSDQKIILKMLSERILPKELDIHRKQGLSAPLAKFLTRGDWQKFFEDVLFGGEWEGFNKNTISKVFKGQYSGRSNSERLFALVQFELWRKEYEAHF